MYEHDKFHAQLSWSWKRFYNLGARFDNSQSLTPGRVAQLVTCLTTDARLNPGVASSIPARSHTFVDIDREIISTVILLPSADSFKKVCCQLQAKVCTRITGQPFVQACPGKRVVRLTDPSMTIAVDWDVKQQNKTIPWRFLMTRAWGRCLNLHLGWLNSAWSLNNHTSSVKHNNIEMKLKTPILVYINELLVTVKAAPHECVNRTGLL